MFDTDFQKRLIARIETELKLDIVAVQASPQGMSSTVFFVKTVENSEYAIKYGADAMGDVPALELIQKNNLGLPVPTLIGLFVFEDVPVIILEKVTFPLLESVSHEELSKYIPSMVQNLQTLHTITSEYCGPVREEGNKKSWKEFLLNMFDGTEFNWEEIVCRNGLEKALVSDSVQKILEKIMGTDFANGPYSLLHTDFNQRNLFVNPPKHEIAGIIDWEEAIFGDPLYDFARVRMYMWHFNLDDVAIGEYYRLMHYTPEQRKLEDLYWLSFVIQYLAWYSEAPNEFNRARIKLHQDYLQAYDWSKKF